MSNCYYIRQLVVPADTGVLRVAAGGSVRQRRDVEGVTGGKGDHAHHKQSVPHQGRVTHS
jgi:hypothetical protein